MDRLALIRSMTQPFFDSPRLRREHERWEEERRRRMKKEREKLERQKEMEAEYRRMPEYQKYWAGWDAYAEACNEAQRQQRTQTVSVPPPQPSNAHVPPFVSQPRPPGQPQSKAMCHGPVSVPAPSVCHSRVNVPGCVSCASPRTALGIDRPTISDVPARSRDPRLHARPPAVASGRHVYGRYYYDNGGQAATAERMSRASATGPYINTPTANHSRTQQYPNAHASAAGYPDGRVQQDSNVGYMPMAMGHSSTRLVSAQLLESGPVNMAMVNARAHANNGALSNINGNVVPFVDLVDDDCAAEGTATRPSTVPATDMQHQSKAMCHGPQRGPPVSVPVPAPSVGHSRVTVPGCVSSASASHQAAVHTDRPPSSNAPAFSRDPRLRARPPAVASGGQVNGAASNRNGNVVPVVDLVEDDCGTDGTATRPGTVLAGHRTTPTVMQHQPNAPMFSHRPNSTTTHSYSHHNHDNHTHKTHHPNQYAPYGYNSTQHRPSLGAAATFERDKAERSRKARERAAVHEAARAKHTTNTNNGPPTMNVDEILGRSAPVKPSVGRMPMNVGQPSTVLLSPSASASHNQANQSDTAHTQPSTRAAGHVPPIDGWNRRNPCHRQRPL